MTEDEWLAFDDPSRLVDYIQRNASDDELLAVSIALCRKDPSIVSDPLSRRTLDWLERVNRGEIGYDDKNGPNNGDCYMMSGAVNRCLAIACDIYRGETDDIRTHISDVLGILTDDADEAERKLMATACRSAYPFSPADRDSRSEDR